MYAKAVCSVNIFCETGGSTGHMCNSIISSLLLSNWTTSGFPTICANFSNQDRLSGQSYFPEL